MKILKVIDNIFGDSLFKNSIYLMATNFIGSILAFLFWVIAARYYMPDDIGIASVIFSSISLISMIGSIGLPAALILYLPRNKDANKIINSCLVTGIISSIIFSSIFVSGLKIWTPELISTFNNFKNVSIFIVVTTAISISILIGATFTAGKRSSFQMIKETIYHFVKMFPLLLFVSFGAMGILISIGIGLVLAVTVGFILLPRVWKYHPKLALDPIIVNMASFSAGNYVTNIFYSLPILILPIIILNMVSARSAGYFYIAIMMTNLLYGISQSVSSSLFAESPNKDQFLNNINKAIKFNLIILIPGLLLFAIFGKLILGIFSPDYAENAVATMIILMIISIPMSLINIFNTIRSVQNRVISAAKMNIMTASITILLSIPLIRIMNIEGAAISYLMANIIGASIVISRIKNLREFTLRLLNDTKKQCGV